MAYRFKPTDPDVPQAIRRIAAEQAANALKTLDDDALPFAQRIHLARKTVKKIRALIRLSRPAFADSDAELAHLRDAAASVADVRESQVLCVLFDALSRDARLPQKDLATLRAPLQARFSAAHEPDGLAAALDGFRKAMQGMERRIPHWDISGSGFPTIRPGIERTWSRARAAMKEAIADPGPEPLHTWRKRVKDHWYQTRLLCPIWPELMVPRYQAADALGEMLGSIHDLDVLTGILSSDTQAAQRMIGIAGTSREALLRQAVPLGRRLIVGRPDDLSGQLRRWWKVWRSQIAASGRQLPG